MRSSLPKCRDEERKDSSREKNLLNLLLDFRLVKRGAEEGRTAEKRKKKQEKRDGEKKKREEKRREEKREK